MWQGYERIVKSEVSSVENCLEDVAVNIKSLEEEHHRPRTVMRWYGCGAKFVNISTVVNMDHLRLIRSKCNDCLINNLRLIATEIISYFVRKQRKFFQHELFGDWRTVELVVNPGSI